MSTEPTPAPSWLARNWKYIAAGLALVGWAIHAYQAISTGAPIPAPPILDSKEPAVNPVPTPEPHPKRHYGWARPDQSETPERVFAASREAIDNLPDNVRLFEAPVAIPVPPPLPFDQGQIGSCGPNSAVGNMLYVEAKAGKHGLPPPSRLYSYYVTRQVMGTTGSDSGVSNASMMKALAQYGFCDEALWPYRTERFALKPTAAAYAQGATRKVLSEAVPQNLSTMKAALAAGKPFVFGFVVYPSFESQAVDQTGIVPMPGRFERTIGGHDILFTGYDDRRLCFRFLNSWGPDWGDRGFGWFPYSYATNVHLAGDFWTITSTGR